MSSRPKTRGSMYAPAIQGEPAWSPPARAQREKSPELPKAMGHVFSGEMLTCHCGKSWFVQRQDPTPCPRPKPSASCNPRTNPEESNDGGTAS